MYATESPKIVNSPLPKFSVFGGVDSRELKNLKKNLNTINNVKINMKNCTSFIIIYFFHLKFLFLNLVIKILKFEPFF
jgi:hypothetical protein